MIDDNKKIYLKSALAGLIGAIGLSIFYWLVLYLVTRDPFHPLKQFVLYKYWMSALVVGFGAQFSLFWYLRIIKRGIAASTKSTMVASAGVSTTAMIACCAHHVIDVLPLLGFSAAALLLSKYQAHFLFLGVLSNLSGIGIMVYFIKFKKTGEI